MWHDGWWMLWGGLMMILFWGGLIVLGFWLVQSLTRRQPGAGDAQAALRIAEERFARGEISREESEQIRHVLQAP